MADSIMGADRRASAGRLVPTALLTVFAVAMFLAGRLWARREVWEAQRAAGLAEQERLAFQAELTACRNALLLQCARGDKSGGDGAEDGTSRIVGHHHRTNRRDPAGDEP
jgi:hypothetical protein